MPNRLEVLNLKSFTLLKWANNDLNLRFQKNRRFLNANSFNSNSKLSNQKQQTIRNQNNSTFAFRPEFLPFRIACRITFCPSKTLSKPNSLKRNSIPVTSPRKICAPCVRFVFGKHIQKKSVISIRWELTFLKLFIWILSLHKCLFTIKSIQIFALNLCLLNQFLWIKDWELQLVTCLTAANRSRSKASRFQHAFFRPFRLFSNDALRLSEFH